MNILVINAGSSSLKYQLLNIMNNTIIAKGMVDRIGILGSIITYTRHTEKGKETQEDVINHTDALQKILQLLTDPVQGVLTSLSEIAAVGHRIVHGGDLFSQATVIDDKVIEKLKTLIPLAPLHNPANIMAIEAIRSLLPEMINVGVFDTAFHQTMKPVSYRYAIPEQYYTRYKIRKYGFHGTSHDYVSQKVAEILGKRSDELNIIVCHVGNGASITAIKKGKVVDTSMGFTPLEGLMMGTRSGDLDPAVLTFLMRKEGLTLDQIDTILNKESGLLGVSGFSSDMRDIIQAHQEGNTQATLALDMYIQRIVKYIGAYVAEMNGCDVIAFTAGTLENSPFIRKCIVDKLERLGITLDETANTIIGQENCISTSQSIRKVLVIPTNEEYMIAKETMIAYNKLDQ